MASELKETAPLIGPYVMGERPRDLSIQKINAMPPEQRAQAYQNIQSINLHSAALGESLDDETVGDMTVRLNGKRVTLGDIIARGERLPDDKKIELVRQVMNQNVTYTLPEVDPFVERRPTAPLKDIGDYAQTTRETLSSGMGDCEDWAIAQADLLARMGIPPENLQVMSGTVYNTNDNSQFDHANLAVKTSSGQWNVMELGQGKVFAAPSSYLEDGIGGYYFVPSISVGADGNVSQFKLDNGTSPSSQKQGFTSSVADYGLDDDRESKITSKSAFNQASSGAVDVNSSAPAPAPDSDPELSTDRVRTISQPGAQPGLGR